MKTNKPPHFKELGAIGEAFFWIINLRNDYSEQRLASPSFFPMFAHWDVINEDDILIVNTPTDPHARIVTLDEHGNFLSKRL